MKKTPALPTHFQSVLGSLPNNNLKNLWRDVYKKLMDIITGTSQVWPEYQIQKLEKALRYYPSALDSLNLHVVAAFKRLHNLPTVMPPVDDTPWWVDFLLKT